ncbi:hypothetical protein ABW19_dt0201162 [Dactylella cylindrospora]|nr:hypothetical protein ABW19_dt0201162 [Dactylella cylindrospora]
MNRIRLRSLNRTSQPIPIIIRRQIKVTSQIATGSKQVHLGFSIRRKILAKLQLPTNERIAVAVEVSGDQIFVSRARHEDFLAVGVGPDDGLRVDEVDANNVVFNLDDFVVEFVGGVDADDEAHVVLWGAESTAGEVGWERRGGAGSDGGEEEGFKLHF